jgi:hypothetical protein
MGPIGCPKMPARNYHNTLHNNAEKRRPQYHYFDYFGGWVGSRPGLHLLAKQKTPVPDENRIKVKDFYYYRRFKILRIDTENLTLERQMDTLPTFREYMPKLK